MRRGRTVVRRRDLEGSERSHGLAAALAEMSSPEFLEALVHGVAQLDSIGGQLFIAAVRNKYAKVTVTNDAGEVLGEQWDRLEDHKDPGDYETDGYVIHWDHIATAVRNARKEPDTEFPTEPQPEAPYEENLRDELDAEVDAELAEERELAAVAAEDSAFGEGEDPAEDHPND